MDRMREKEKARKRRVHKFRVREQMRRYARDLRGYNERDFDYWHAFMLFADGILRKGHSREETIQHLVMNEIQIADTYPNCSCMSCGNPRRHFNERTIQERKFEERIK